MPGLWSLVTGDVAWGGNWFFLVPSPTGRFAARDSAMRSRSYAARIRRALVPRGVRGRERAPRSTTSSCSARPPDPAPTVAISCSALATPTTARRAAPAPAPSSRAYGPTGSCDRARSGGRRASRAACSRAASRSTRTTPTACVPEITGVAYITGESTLLLDERDPLAWGIRETPLSKRILIVGGGVVGFSVAYHAARKGHRVTPRRRRGNPTARDARSGTRAWWCRATSCPWRHPAWSGSPSGGCGARRARST